MATTASIPPTSKSSYAIGIGEPNRGEPTSRLEAAPTAWCLALVPSHGVRHALVRSHGVRHALVRSHGVCLDLDRVSLPEPASARIPSCLRRRWVFSIFS